LDDRQVSYAVIGALAMAFYGWPRYTADIDLLTDEVNRDVVFGVMADLDFECFQDAGSFAQFDSAYGVYGSVDFMFVSTPDGRAMLSQSAFVKDEAIGMAPVIQPTDYTILKLMAIANNEQRISHDLADLDVLFKAQHNDLISPAFRGLELKRIWQYADRFGVTELLSSILPKQ
jgi:hypothetical protein